MGLDASPLEAEIRLSPVELNKKRNRSNGGGAWSGRARRCSKPSLRPLARSFSLPVFSFQTQSRVFWIEGRDLREKRVTRTLQAASALERRRLKMHTIEIKANHRSLLALGRPVWVLDGDKMREGLCSDLGFYPSSSGGVPWGALAGMLAALAFIFVLGPVVAYQQIHHWVADEAASNQNHPVA
jgi:hypothetical protein